MGLKSEYLLYLCLILLTKFIPYALDVKSTSVGICWLSATDKLSGFDGPSGLDGPSDWSIVCDRAHDQQLNVVCIVLVCDHVHDWQLVVLVCFVL